MKIPEIEVVVRYTKSETRAEGFPVPCVKYGEGRYSSMYNIEETMREEPIYKGPCPRELRILPYVDPKYLMGYMNFYSQMVPQSLDLTVAAAVRGTCWDKIFDRETYHPSGKIISIYENKRHSAEVLSFLTMFLKKEDYDRIDRWEEYDIENWGHDFYMSHPE